MKTATKQLSSLAASQPRSHASLLRQPEQPQSRSTQKSNRPPQAHDDNDDDDDDDSGYGVIMHFYKLFRVLTLFSENCSYNTLRFIFIILLPVKAAWPHDDDDDDDDDDDFFFFFFFFLMFLSHFFGQTKHNFPR